jgi:4-hydroxy-2-oxoheptanedioate aldolase
MSYANHSVNVEKVDETALFGVHKLLARTRNVSAGEKKPVIGMYIINFDVKVLMLIGSWLQLPGSNSARMIASMGYDFILVDTEHGDIDDGEMHRLVAAIGNQGCSPIVRIPAPENFLVKRALDTGGEYSPIINRKPKLTPFNSTWTLMPHDVHGCKSFLSKQSPRLTM